jgi:photosystem II stability/assembly factor-like uncharacterized protein
MVFALAGASPGWPAGAAQDWEAAGFGGGGYFQAIAVDPADSRILYLTSDVSGINKSTNYGESWFKINAGLASREVGALAIDPVNSLRLWAGTPLGLYASTNGGARWALVAADIVCYKHVNYRGITINRQGTLLVAGHRLDAPAEPPDTGNLIGQLYRSTDGGRSWTLNAQLAGQFAGSFRRLPAVVFDPHNDQQAFLLVEGVGPLKSTDEGVSWSYFTNGLPAGLNWRNMDVGSNVVYAAAAPTLPYRSPKTSAAWQLAAGGISGPEDAGGYPIADALRVSPANDRAVYLGQAGWPYVLYRSSNSGQSWIGSAVPENYAFDTIHAPFQTWNDLFQAPIGMAIDPSNPQRIYYTTWWGAWRSDDGGVNWAEKVVGAQNTDCTGVLAEGQTVFATHMDVGVYRSLDAGRTWRPCFPTPGQQSIELHAWCIERGSDGKIYAGLTVHSSTLPATAAVCRSDDGGATWQVKTNGIYRPADFDLGSTVTLAAAPRQAGTIYLGVESFTDRRAIHRSTDYGNTWAPLPKAPGSADNTNSRRVKCLEVDTVSTNRLFAGLYWEGLWYSEDGGANWARARGNGVDLDYASVQQIVALADGSVYAACYDGLYKSTDHGHTFSPVLTHPNWGEDSLEYVYAVAFNPADPKDMFLSTAKVYPVWCDRGSVWRSRDGGATWADITGNLPAKSVVALSCQAGYLYAATWGANVYRASLAPAVPPRLAIALTVTNTLTLSWQPPSAGFVLQQNSNLGLANWADVTNVPTPAGDGQQVIVGRPEGNQFYRLRQP